MAVALTLAWSATLGGAAEQTTSTDVDEACGVFGMLSSALLALQS
jgi:hypothetical protein